MTIEILFRLSPKLSPVFGERTEALNFLALLKSGAHAVFNNTLATRKILFLKTVFYFRSNSAHNKGLVAAFRPLKTNVIGSGVRTELRSLGLRQSTLTEDR